MTRSQEADKCRRIQELLVWFPSGTLDEAETAEVEAHVAGCAECSGLLEFADELKTGLRARYSAHPDADDLVCFAENKAGMDPVIRSRIETHLSLCPACREELAILEAVDRGGVERADSTETAGVSRSEPAASTPVLGRLWSLLRGSILRPIPAAVYLILVALGIGLYTGGPLRRWAAVSGPGKGEVGMLQGADGVSGMLSGVVVLPDETGRVREPGAEVSGGAEIDVGKAQFLLLELIGLESPPQDDDRYTLELIEAGSPDPVLEAHVMGRDFRETYTLCLSITEGGLAPGTYTVSVIDPDGNPVFRSTVTGHAD